MQSHKKTGDRRVPQSPSCGYMTYYYEWSGENEHEKEQQLDDESHERGEQRAARCIKLNNL